MPRTPWLMAAALWLAGSVAHADYVLESPPVATRQVADAELARISGALDPALRARLVLRVVRRYVRGTGWRYFVAVEQLPELADARGVAPLVAVGGAPATAWEVLGLDRRPVDLGAPAGSAEPAAAPAPAPASPPKAPAATAVDLAARPAPDPVRARAKSATAVLRAAVKAHGGRGGGLAVLDAADAVAFTFVRTVQDGGAPLTARHSVLLQGDAARVAVEILEGEGTSSELGLTADGRAWLQVAGGAAIDRQRAPVAELVARLDPRTVLDGVLDLATDIETGVAWRGLERAGPADTAAVVLRPAQAAGTAVPADGLVEAAFDAKTHQLVRLVWQRGATRTTYRYDGYFEVAPGVIAPRNVRVSTDGKLVETLVIEQLSPRPAQAPRAFDPPA